MRRHALIVAVIAATCTMPLRADIIQLKNGRTISGSMTRQGNVMVIRADDGTITRAAPGTGPFTPALRGTEWA